MSNFYSPLGLGLGEEEPADAGASASPRLLDSVDESRAFHLFAENARRLKSIYPNVRVARDVPEENVHTVEVPFVVREPGELLVDVLASKMSPLETVETIELARLRRTSLAGRIVLLVCTSAVGRISAVSTTVMIGSSRVTLQELHDCGLLPQRGPTLQLVTVVSRVWRALGCLDSATRQSLGGLGRILGGGNRRNREQLRRPPAISRADVESFLASGTLEARSLLRKVNNPQISSDAEACVMDCFMSTSAGMSWLAEAREMVRAMEEANEERATQVAGLESQLAVVGAEYRAKSEEFREKSARRERVRQLLAPDVLKSRLARAAEQERSRAWELAEAWNGGAGMKDDVFVREYVDALAAALAAEAKRDLLLPSTRAR